jgi:hypothetical protein
MSYDKDDNDPIDEGLMRRVLKRIGRKGGQAKSERKTAACRANAKLPRTRKNGAFGTAGKGGLKRKLTRRAQR